MVYFAADLLEMTRLRYTSTTVNCPKHAAATKPVPGHPPRHGFLFFYQAFAQMIHGPYGAVSQQNLYTPK